jgi:hypothetical protein
MWQRKKILGTFNIGLFKLLVVQPGFLAQADLLNCWPPGWGRLFPIVAGRLQITSFNQHTFVHMMLLLQIGESGNVA